MSEKCALCKGIMEERTVSLDLRVDGQLVVIENVPALVCADCGEKVVAPEVGRKIEKLVRQAGTKAGVKTISVPVMDLKKVS